MNTNIASGINWLNVYVPGWENHINVSILDMSELSRCVIGQLGILDHSSHYYNRNLETSIHNGNSIAWDVELGFCTLRNEDCNELTREWKELTREWKEVITSRRNSLTYSYLCIVPYTQAL